MTLLTYKTKDRDKGITRITYNNIGLVDSILFDNGAKVLYTYGVNGEKLRVRHYAASSNVISHISAIRPGTNTIRYSEEEYIGGELVKSGSVSGTSSTPPTYKCYFGDGYISFNSFDLSFNSDIVPEYYYYSKDHLGNVRSVVTKDKSTNTVTEVQKTHYYPFGGIIADLSTGRNVQNRLYNGKELDTSNNLWWYDYGARQYDPTAPHFTTSDPLAEKYYGWNMYGYCVNNPVKFVDPDGEKIVGINGYSAISINSSGGVFLTKYATQDIKRIYNSLRKTRTGLKMLKQAIRSDIKVSMSISSESKVQNGVYSFGETVQGNRSKKDNYGRFQRKDGKFGIKEASVVIYEGTINQASNQTGMKHEGLTVDQIIGAVAGHELVHATDSEEIHKDIATELSGKKRSKRETEDKPNRIESNIIRESLKTK